MPALQLGKAGSDDDCDALATHAVELDFPSVKAGERFAGFGKGTLFEDPVVVAVCVVMLGGRRP